MSDTRSAFVRSIWVATPTSLLSVEGDVSLAYSAARSPRRVCGYTSGMKTAISIPDDLFRRADELAGRLGKSRSELYREALADYVARRDTGAVTSALNEIVDEVAADRAGFGDRAARRVLERDEW